MHIFFHWHIQIAWTLQGWHLTVCQCKLFVNLIVLRMEMRERRKTCPLHAQQYFKFVWWNAFDSFGVCEFFSLHLASRYKNSINLNSVEKWRPAQLPSLHQDWAERAELFRRCLTFAVVAGDTVTVTCHLQVSASIYPLAENKLWQFTGTRSVCSSLKH